MAENRSFDNAGDLVLRELSGMSRVLASAHPAPRVVVGLVVSREAWSALRTRSCRDRVDGDWGLTG